MSRSGYVDADDEDASEQAYDSWRAEINTTIRSEHMQAFLVELAGAMDAMPNKILIHGELIDAEGDCCTIGVVCKARGVDVAGMDFEDPDVVGFLAGIPCEMAAEIEYQNDEGGSRDESPESRWRRMRKWVARKIRKEAVI